MWRRCGRGGRLVGEEAGANSDILCLYAKCWVYVFDDASKFYKNPFPKILEVSQSSVAFTANVIAV